MPLCPKKPHELGGVITAVVKFYIESKKPSSTTVAPGVVALGSQAHHLAGGRTCRVPQHHSEQDLREEEWAC